jgi:nucleoside-diphosphate-sugar epimerase
MRVMVIGGTRFIGPAVVKRLAHEGHEVTLFHRGVSESAELPDVRHLHGERQRLAEFSATFKEWAPEVVLDMRAMTEHEAKVVMDTFRGIASRVVAISSVDVYRAFARVNGTEPGAPDPVPLTEDAPLREVLYPFRGIIEDRSDYDKILVERVVMGDPAITGTVLRLPFVYGPGDYQHRLFYYLKRMDSRRPAIALDDGVATWRSTHGYVENVAAAIALAVTDERASGRTYNVGEPYPFSELEWVRAIGRAADWDGEVVVVQGDALQAPFGWWQGINAEQALVADSSRIRSELGFAEPVEQDRPCGAPWPGSARILQRTPRPIRKSTRPRTRRWPGDPISAGLV